MWIFSRLGFFSIVALNTDSNWVMVRARSHRHLTALVTTYGIEGPHATIHKTPKADYPYRIVMPKTEWQRIMHALVQDIDYGNFKNSVDKREGDYLTLLHNIWSAVAKGMDHLRPRMY